MEKCDPNRLLRAVKSVHVHVGDVPESVVGGWFDTDDTDVLDMLRFLCTSLSSENYASPELLDERLAEVEEQPPSDEELEHQMRVHRDLYPDILYPDLVKLENEEMAEDLEELREYQEETVQILEVLEGLDEEHTRKLSEVTSTEIELQLKHGEADECFKELSSEMDGLNEDLYEPLCRFSVNLTNFGYNGSSSFINNASLIDSEDSLQSIKNFTTFCRSGQDMSSSLESINQSSLKLDDFLHRICEKVRNFLEQRVLKSQLEHVLQYLATVSPTDFHTTADTWESREHQVKMLCDMIQTVSSSYADKCAGPREKRQDKAQIRCLENKIRLLESILENVNGFRAYASLALYLFKQEKSDMADAKEFFKKNLGYVLRELELCKTNTAYMETVLAESRLDSGHPKLLKMLSKIVSSGQDSPGDMLDEVCAFRQELQNVERELFMDDPEKIRLHAYQMHKNVETLSEFVTNGPTHRVVAIPHKLEKMVKEVDLLVKNQVASVQNGLAVAAEIKQASKGNVWKKHQRQLWMYFLSDRAQLESVLRDIKNRSEQG